MLEETKDWKIFLLITLSITAILIVIWSFNGQWITNTSPYNTYTLQAQAWLNGSVNIADYKHLELAYYKDKVYVSFPPFPSVVMLPFVAIMETKTPDGIINLFFIIVGVFAAYKLAQNFNYSILLSLSFAFFLTIASNVLFLMQNGWVWFFAQTLSFTFTILAFYFATKKEPNFHIAFLLLAFAIGCRPFQMIYGVFILYLAYQHTKDIKTLASYMFPAIFMGVLYASYNYIRFDSIVEFGHNYLKEMTQSEHGQFSFAYVLENLKKLYYIPGMAQNGIINYPKFNGFSIFLLNPILIPTVLLIPLYLASTLRNDASQSQSNLTMILILIGSVLLHTLAISMHITMGGWHFGNRYLIDALPALFVLFLLLDSKISYLRLFYIPLFFQGLALNIIGTTLFYVK